MRVPPSPAFCILMLDGASKLGKNQGVQPNKDLNFINN